MRQFAIAALAFLLANPAARAEETAPVPAETAERMPAEELADLIARHRGALSLPGLVRRPVLDRVASMTAAHLAGTGPTPMPNHAEVYSDLVRRLYIPMMDLELAAHAGADAGGALAVLLGDPRTAAALAEAAVEEFGIAVEPNPAATGPHEAFTWVVLLAKPLRTPAESADSPRFGQ